jgi:hypothetical protein
MTGVHGVPVSAREWPSSEIGLRGSSTVQHVAPAHKRKTPTCEGARRASSFLPRLCSYPLPTAEKREGSSAKPKVSAFESKSVAAPTTKRWVTACIRSASPHDLRLVAIRLATFRMRTGREGQPLLWEDAEGGNRCVCPVDVASPMSLMETSGTSSIRISRRRVTLPRSRSRKRCGTSRRRSGPSILVRLLADDSPVSRDWHHELPPSS